ncbi:hypothetical protein DTO021D3_9194 [Paecilomyces variotii]|nr:hypothetical protein DTO032I3_9167 [Paecilomyces variotii]KAJ9273944.1 hypothetical protein DTO021D3_9194 [Paecilomyces variotii]KAJ9338535.1 hypothetical protein DTO027B6_8934 [Paecilomyces variotii]KAJ9393341.1 hypothetical protein DTO032I4_112 [Paecilomyces variotii]KAJ9405699.1 hypothetical protein DTO045G8_6532 [Paecilomyces variotii]
MAATVLGKRQRSAIGTEALPLRSPSKRRTRAPRILEEVGNPSISSTRQLRSRTRDCSPQQENDPNVKASTAGNVPSKHTVSDEKPSSPKKNDSHVSAAKSVSEENPRSTGFKTPQSARYRDALAQSPPVTPRHRVQVGAGRSLTPRTPRHLSTPTATTQTVYTPARQLFARSARPGRLVGRDREREQLTSFIQNGVDERRGGCLYVSGPPGTGKSAMVEEVCKDMDLGKTVKVTHVNCVSMRSARDVYGKLVDDLCDDSQVFKKTEADRLKDMFIATKKPDTVYLVTLDEIDHLLTTDSEVLYSLFEWSLHSRSCLMLIGIANALDLTDRFLPRLKAKNLKPSMLPFLPYTAPQIANVITTRLRSLLPNDQDSSSDFVPFLHPTAIQLCSKKVASQTGDLRKAFELIKRAIDVIEQETLQKLDKQNAVPDSPSKTALGENLNLSSPSRTAASKAASTAVYTPFTAPRATIAHIARITSAAFGQGTTQRLQGLNLQQKAALCALIALDRKRRDGDVYSTPTKSRASAPTIKQLYDTYCALCRNDNVLQPLTGTEFKDVISSLETMGLVGEIQGRGRGGTVPTGSGILRTPSKSGSGSSTPSKSLDEKGLACFVTQKEVETHISGPGEGILRALLSGEGL